MKHYLKIHPVHYFRVKSGSKTFEIRKNDRFFQKTDEIELYYFDPEYPSLGEYGNPRLTFQIGDVYQIDSERVVFSLLKPTEQDG